MKKFFILIFALLTLTSTSSPQNKDAGSKLMTGADRLISEDLNLLQGKRLGIVTNPTAVLSNGVHIVDSLYHIKGIKISALFGPEHGIRGAAPAGEHVSGEVDPKTNIPVYSLYGKTNKPTPEMLKNVDILIFDIQDIGARFYTYISTLFYVVQAAAENNIPLLVLDRPNPINGVSVEGPVRTKEEKSFVGIAPIPIMHGMTVGELAKMFAGEGWIGKNLKPELTVIKMKNWKRDSYIDDYSIPWVKPSPNIPDVNTAIVYPGTCLIEGTNTAEGRGTYHPFLTIGAPYIDSDKLIDELKNNGIPGLRLEAISFTPVSIPHMSTSPKYKNEKCSGIKITLVNRKVFKPVSFGINLVYSLHKLFKDFKFRDAGFDRLSGDKKVREQILSGVKPDEIIASWQPGLKNFLKIREKYLLY